MHAQYTAVHVEAELRQTLETAAQQESSISCHHRLRADAEAIDRFCRAKTEW